MRKFFGLVWGILFVFFVFVGCKPEIEEHVDESMRKFPVTIQTPSPTPSPTPTPEPTPDLTNKAINKLTGLYIDADVATRRPVTVVINNLHKALPQSGLSQADVIYEVLAEGDITRLIAVFRDFNSEKIGPVRSTRHYFLDFALDHDAFFVHHGGSPQGYSSIQTLGINNLDGMRENYTFWRDPNRVNAPGMYEHSSYTNAERILTTLDTKGYRLELFEDEDYPFEFYQKPTSPSGGLASGKITVPFSNSYTTVFEYSAVSNTYKKFQGDQKHIDEETGEQLEVTNVIVQFTSMYVMAGDDAGRREVKLVANGDGYLITNGVYVPIKWEKASHASPTMWYDEAGKKLTLNQGKTWICVYSGEVDFGVEQNE